jgi:WD repeat-containing protein 24
MMDFRKLNDVVLEFKHDAGDKVTDLQFNPSYEMPYQFASGGEGGGVYIWDIRNPSNYEKRFNAHLSVVHLEWHPEFKNWIATGSINGKIFIWDTGNDKKGKNSNTVTCIHSVTHPESVFSLKWRPTKEMEITACSTDAHLYVWDLNRPFVPYCSFDLLTNKVKSKLFNILLTSFGLNFFFLNIFKRFHVA